MLKAINKTPVKITLNADTYNWLVNIMLAIHYINDQPLITNKKEVKTLLQHLLQTESFIKYLEDTFNTYDEYIKQKF